MIRKARGDFPRKTHRNVESKSVTISFRADGVGGQTFLGVSTLAVLANGTVFQYNDIVTNNSIIYIVSLTKDSTPGKTHLLGEHVTNGSLAR